MNQHLQTILNFIQRSEHLSEEEKTVLFKAAKDADKELEITSFKLDHIEKVKSTTAVLLEETIKELGQKRKSVEAQNRELEIEASLEKVRAIALSMKAPSDMLEVCTIIAKELDKLSVKEIRNVQTAIFYEEKGTYMNYEYYARHDKTVITETSYTNHTMHQAFANQMLKGKGEFFSTHLSKAELPDWIAYQKTTNVFIDNFISGAASLDYYWFSLGAVALGISTYLPLNEEEINLFKRFRNVFELSYRRYLDIEKAEAQARESQIQLALERVRARTMAMQKSEELAETAAVLFQQLIHLGIAPNRLYIGIIQDDTGTIEFWITDEDGTKVSTMFSGDANKNLSMQKMYDGWKTQQRSIMIDMQEKELADYFHYLGDELHVPFKGGLSQKRRLQYISYFSKGFIGMASPDEQPQETVDLLNRFAYVFNLTFTRFNDLKIAEAHAIQAEEDLIKLQTEKKRAEDALHELKETQKQLIQSEKMASLGELTAGIAHEIQNPLNFVNNFSEVSNELISELVDEVDKGNTDEVKAIAKDIKQNLEKINHHGKRADAIVKGMLQHSRKSEGVKEPTDINALCDEYLRLSYHGLRAKDKGFNADFKTDFDKSIGKINIVPQDIGRVLLNLYNNAFYATIEKLTAHSSPLTDDYKPLVLVQTKKINDKVEITVSDNGNGIPASIKDKIFQPFFTTKPTGQGTGLGLSLAYDIIKAHGGEIKVETRDGEGSELIIQLPFTR